MSEECRRRDGQIDRPGETQDAPHFALNSGHLPFIHNAVLLALQFSTFSTTFAF
jgi:hypothetical protein